MNQVSTVACLMVVLVTLLAAQNVLAKDKHAHHMKEKDMMRKSIVYDKKTPNVFYCPTSKPSGFDKLIVKAKPLHKLCEYEGKELPAHYKSDCYMDVDESDYACKEKYRIMKRFAKSSNE